MSCTHRRLVVLAFATLLSTSSALANGLTVEPEAVFLKFGETDLTYAVEGEMGDAIEDGTGQTLSSGYEAGYRVSIGYNWEGWWDATVRTTHVDTTERGTADDSGGALWATTLHPGASFFDDDEFMRIDSELELDLDITDIEIGKTWNCEHGGHVRLFFGARLSWFDQDSASIHYNEETIWEVTETWLDWRGAGPLVGVTGALPLGRESGWTVFGTVAGSVQFGQIDGIYNDIYVPSSTMKADTEVVQYAYDESKDTTATTLEGRIGFGWDWEMDRVTFGLRFGYEYQLWNDMPTTASLIADAQAGESISANEDFNVHGFFFGLGWYW